MNEHAKQDILEKIRQIARDTGQVPGRQRFEAATGIKRHEWLGKIWRNWGDAVSEAGFAENKLTEALDEEAVLAMIHDIARSLQRFPSWSDLNFELHRREGSPSAKSVTARWPMAELADALAKYAEAVGSQDVASYAKAYIPKGQKRANTDRSSGAATGYVYMQRHGSDYKVGYTTSLNKRGRQIQIELPQEIELVHSILTDDPAGIEAYWHKRFATKRTRGEWFKLSSTDVAAFKRWSKIW